MQKTLVALLALSATSLAFAADEHPFKPGFYVGGTFGQSQVRNTGYKVDGDAKKTDLNLFQDKKGGTAGVFAGYRFNDYVSLQLGFNSWAPYKAYSLVPADFKTPTKSVEFNANTKTVEELKQNAKTVEAFVSAVAANPANAVNPGQNAQLNPPAGFDLVYSELKQKAVDLTVKGNYFLGDHFSPYVGLGVALVRNNYSNFFFADQKALEKGETHPRNWNVAPVGVAGAEFYFVPSFSVGAEAKFYLGADRKAAKEYPLATRFVAETEKLNAALTGAAGARSTDLATLAKADEDSGFRPNVLLLQATASYLFGQNKEVVVEAPKVVIEKFQLSSDVLFTTASYKLAPNAASVLAPIVERYKNGIDARLEVVGHADRTGSAKFNQRLSEQRAVSVTTHLVQQGIKADDIVARGVGSTDPVTDGCYNVKNKKQLRACLAPDRRVDVFISGTVKK